jgi:hypothetical protein
MNRIVVLTMGAALALSSLMSAAEQALAKGKNHDIVLPVGKSAVHKPFDKDGYHFVCDARGYCGNWNIGSISH